MARKVFLSHNWQDKAFVREFDSALRAFGVDTFLDERDIALGEEIPQRVFEEIAKASHVMYFISSHSVSSKWVQKELSVAEMQEKQSRGPAILPILIESLPELPPAVSSRRYADFTDRHISVSADNFQLAWVGSNLFFTIYCAL